MGGVDEPSVAVVTGRASDHILTFFFLETEPPIFIIYYFLLRSAIIRTWRVFTRTSILDFSDFAEFLGIHCICLHNNVMPAFFA